MKRIALFPFIIISFIVFLIQSVGQTKAQSLINNYLELLGGYVKAQNPSSVVPPSAFSFEAWIKPEVRDYVAQSIILSIGDKMSGGGAHYEVSIKGNRYLDLTYRHGIGGLTGLMTGEIREGQWNHIAVTISSSKAQLFINGQLEFAPSLSNGPLLLFGPSIVLGDSYLESFFSSKSFRGAIDEVRISKVVRDVASLWGSGAYNGDLLGDPDTVLLWRMNQTRGETTVVDSSANGIDGTMIGGDSKIHFAGLLPTPTPWTLALPTVHWNRPILPTLSWPLPTSNSPTVTPTPSSAFSFPTTRDIHVPRPTRPLFR